MKDCLFEALFMKVPPGESEIRAWQVMEYMRWQGAAFAGDSIQWSFKRLLSVVI